MQTVWIIALDNVMDSSLAITLDVLRTARILAAQGKSPSTIDYKVLSAKAYVQTACGAKLRADATFRQALQAIKAGGDTASSTPHCAIVPAMGEYGAQLAAHLELPDAIQGKQLLQALYAKAQSQVTPPGEKTKKAGNEAQAKKIKSTAPAIAAACASVYLLAEAGLLEGRTATITWWFANGFRERYPNVTLDERRMVVRDGPCLTAGAAFAQLDLMLDVVAHLAGKHVADLCARYLLIDRRPSQARYMMATHAQRHDPAVAAAERWIDEHLAAPLTVRALAEHLALSEKTLARKVLAATGQPTIKLIQRRRLLMATHLLETTKLPIEQVAARVGYSDSTTLRRLIRRELEVSPSGLR